MSSEAFTVLLVEDNPGDAKLLQLAVDDSRSPVLLRWVKTLSAAANRLRRERFDAVLLDLSLPDTVSLEALARLRVEAPSVPVVVLTGLDDQAIAAAALREGAQDYLVKGKADGELVIRAIRYAIERKHATDALRHSERQFRSLIENALDVIAVVDAAGRIRYGSPSVERVAGYTPAEIVGCSAFRLIHPDDVPAVQRAVAACALAPGTQSVQFRVRHRKNGDWRVLEAICRNLLDEPAVGGIVINCRDITDRREADVELRKLHETLRAVIETSPLAILSLDIQGHVQSWNRAAEEILGWNAADVLGQRAPIELQEGFEEFLQAALRGETLVARASRLRQKNGALVDVHIWTGLLRDAAGAAGGIVAVIADATESRRLEEQLLHVQKMDAIGRLAGGVAHDFNNLLTVITGCSQLILQRLAPTDAIRTELDQVLRAAGRAANLTGQLLTFSRRQLVEPRTLDLNALVSDTHRMLQRIIGEDVEIVVQLGPRLPTIKADPAQLETVLLNLAVNARDAMPNGGCLRIETGIAHIAAGPPGPVALPPGCYVTLAVSDTGQGVSPAAAEHLFEPFFTTKPPGRGTGLGLSTSYGIVRQHGGDFHVSSTPGKGSTFQVFLPAAAEERGPKPSILLPKIGTVARDETILLVEDEDGVRHVIGEILSGEGYRVLSAGGAEEGIRLCREHPGAIHLLISDVVMPQMNGVDLGERLRALRPGIKVLYVSGYAQGAVTESALSDRGIAFLQKPFSSDLLALKIREILEG